jgi:predicted HTH transcriptional regulator
MLHPEKIGRDQVSKLRESQTHEFKESLSLQKEAFVALCGMLNSETGRGMILFGIKDNSEVIGLGNTGLDTAQKTLVNHAKQKFDPPIQLEVHVLDCEGLPLLAIASHRPRIIQFFEYDGRAHIREGSTTRVLSVGEKMRLSHARNRDLHNGPWTCSRCRTFVGVMSNTRITDSGIYKSYNCPCGGEYWPA